MKKRKLLENLDEAFGESSPTVRMPEKFWKDLQAMLEKRTADQIGQVIYNPETLANILKEQKATNERLLELAKAIAESKTKSVEVSNFPKQKDIPEVKIPSYPKSIEVKKPSWYEKFIPDRIIRAIESLSKQQKSDFEEALDRHKKLENALAVRLASSDLRMFYNAIATAVSGGMRTLSADDVVTANQGAPGSLPWVISLPTTTSGGYSIFRSIDLDETEEAVKASPGQIFGWYLYNNATTTRYVKVYNDTVANVVVGTTTPVLTIPIPPQAAANVEFIRGIPFSVAITAAATTGVADNDTGAPSANDVVGNVFYA